MDLGISEVLLIMFIALIIFGPGKLPELARTLGKASRQFRETSNGFLRSLNEEIMEDKGHRESSPEKAAKRG